MTPSVDLSPPRRPIFFPVVIATVFLTIIGMTGGYVLGERHRRDTAAQQENQQQQQQHQPAAVSTSTTTAAPSTLCPAATQKEAARLGFPTELTQVRRYVTTNGSVVWICRDRAGHLYYQGKVGGENAPLEQGTNALLLNDVEETGTDAYRVVSKSDGVKFEISPQALVVEKASQTERYPVKSMQ